MKLSKCSLDTWLGRTQNPPPQYHAVYDVNNCFQVALLVGLIYTTCTKGSQLYAVEAWIVLVLHVLGDGGGRSRKRYRPESTVIVWFWFKILLDTSFRVYLVWFIFTGMDRMQHPYCATFTFFFAKVSLYGWFRKLVKVVSVVLLYSSAIEEVFMFQDTVELFRHNSLPEAVKHFFGVYAEEIWESEPYGVKLGTLLKPIELILLVITIEMTIRWNKIGVGNIRSTGQIIPLAVGLTSFLKVLRNVLLKQMRPDYACNFALFKQRKLRKEKKMRDSQSRDILHDLSGCPENGVQEAAWMGNAEFVKLLLDWGVDTNACDSRYGSALQAAAYRGHLEVVQLLLQAGTEVNFYGNCKGTPLEMAIDRDYPIIVQLLLDNGADVNIGSGVYGSPLQIAAYKGSDTIVRLLLNNGAKVNSQGSGFGTAMQAAAFGGSEAVVNSLLEKGADINIQGGYYENALHAAVVGNHEMITKILFERRSILTYGVLASAAFRGDEAAVKMLLDSGARVTEEALQRAALGGHNTVLQLLIDKHDVLRHRHFSLEDLWMGVYVKALRAAAWRGHEGTVRLLLDAGLDVNSQDFDGNALQAAAWRGHETIVQLLLDRGAKPNTKGGWCYGTALEAALAGGHKTIANRLRNQGARRWTLNRLYELFRIIVEEL